MTQAEIRLIEEGWTALVAQLGLAGAMQFVMLLDRRTGSGLQHLQHLWADAFTESSYRTTVRVDQPMSQLEAR